MEYNRNFFIAIALSFLLILAFQFLFPPQSPPPQGSTASDASSSMPKPNESGAIPLGGPARLNLSRNQLLNENQRIIIDTPKLKGSINLQGANFDDLLLKDYHEKPDASSPFVALLNPTGLDNGFMAEFGFSSNDKNLALPQSNSVWQLAGNNNILTPQSPISLIYNSENGLSFERTIAVDNDYMFTITDHITNKGPSDVDIFNYGRIARAGAPKGALHNYLLHEGLIARLDSLGLKTESYSDMEKLKSNSDGSQNIQYEAAQSGWLGITDKYWAVVAIPEGHKFTSRFNYFPQFANHFQTDFITNAITIKPNETVSVTNRLFAGAKQVNILNQYQDKAHIEQFGLLIDWGLFSFITKPMFFLIDWLFKLLGNFGLAILATTVILKIITFPLSHKSYESMAKMRLLQPKLAAIKESYSDLQEQQKATFELYRKEKINPFAGCFPILIQMPIFFALYKVLYITIEMRHAPFYGWINDLAARDPTSIFNLFGLLPYSVPDFFMIGAWPIIMGITMFLQMRMSPLPQDNFQARFLTWLPLIVTFMLASFPVGLVIYWAWNNSLTIIQQAIIIKKNGGKIELWDNLKALFSRKNG